MVTLEINFSDNELMVLSEALSDALSANMDYLNSNRFDGEFTKLSLQNYVVSKLLDNIKALSHAD